MKLTKLAVTIGAGLIASSLSAQVASHEQRTPQASPHGAMSGSPHGTGTTATIRFAKECGLADAKAEAGTHVARSANGKWHVATQSGPEEALGVVWLDEQGNIRVVSMNQSNAAGDTLQFTRMCFRPDGSLKNAHDEYVSIPTKVGRVTEIASDEQGKQIKNDQAFYQLPSHTQIAAPAAASGFPKINIYKSAGELPFAALVKKKK